VWAQTAKEEERICKEKPGNQLSLTIIIIIITIIKILGHAVAQMVEALRYMPEGRGFNSRCCHWNFLLT
jgi:hypothetical protein